jgi:hypothetical protein
VTVRHAFLSRFCPSRDLHSRSLSVDHACKRSDAAICVYGEQQPSRTSFVDIPLDCSTVPTTVFSPLSAVESGEC